MKKRVGTFLLEKGLLTPKQLEDVLSYGKKHSLRVGDAAIELGLLSHNDLAKVFGPSHKFDFFYMDYRYLPKQTRDLFPIEFMLKHGVIPLGFKTEWKFFKKKRYLNLGLLAPERQESVIQAETIAKERLANLYGTKVFLVLADQFIQTLNQAYKIPTDQISTKATEGLDPILEMFIQS